MMNYFNNLFNLFVDMSFYIMIGLFAVGVLNTFVNKKWITSQIGSDNFFSVLKASIIGVPLPLCSCGVVPTAIELKKSGGSNGSVVSFLISTPQTGVDSIVATWGMLGPFMAFFRAIAAFISGVFGGIVVNIFGKNEKIKISDVPTCHCEGESKCSCESEKESHCCCSSEKETSCSCESEKESHCCCSSEKETSCSCESEKESHCCCSSEKETSCSCETEKESHCCYSSEVETSCSCESEKESESKTCCCSSEVSTNELTFVQKIKHVFTYGFGSFLNEIAGHFTIGLMISALISTIIPDDFFVSAGLDNGILAMLTMVIVGIPMYICSTSSIPIAVSLVLKGLSPGAAFVFLFTGPVTNAASVTILLKTLGKKITAIYLSCVVVCSVGFGLLLDFIAATFTAEFFDITSMHTHEHGTPFYYYIVAIVFGLLLVRSLIIRLKETIKS